MRGLKVRKAAWDNSLKMYHMEKYEGADKLVAKMNFSEKFADANNPKAGKKYVLNGKEISSDEYAAFASKIFAAEESTD